MAKAAQPKNWFRSSVGLAFLLNLACLILVIVFCDMKYEVSDDFVVDAVLSGAYGTGYDAHLLFSNILYGGFLKLLYQLIPMVSWYFVCQIAICFLALWAVSFIVMERNHWAVGVLLCIVLLVFFSDDLYILVQFTKTAAVASCAGGVLFLYGFWKKEGRSLPCILLGGGLMLAGSMLRFNCFYIALAFLLLVLIRYIWEARKQNKGKALLKKTLWGVLLCLVLIACAFGLRGISNAVWNSNPDYAAYRTYNSLRASVTDTKGYGYESIKEQLDELGYSETDFQMIASWNFLDREYFTDEDVEQVAEATSEYNEEVSSVRQAVKTFRDNIKDTYRYYVVVFGIAVMFVLLLFLQPKRVPWELVGLALCAALLIYFIWTGRVVYRVEYSVFACMAIGLITSFNKEEIKLVPQIIVLCLAAFFCAIKIPLYLPDTSWKTMTDEEYEAYVYKVLNPSGTFDIRKYRINVSKRAPYGDLTDYIEADADGYYLLDFNTTIQQVYYNYKPWIRLPIGYWRDYYSYLGGVTTGFPGNTETWEAHGIDARDPYKSIVDDGIYVVDNVNDETKLEYLRERYYPNARKELVDTIDGMKIWKYYAE